MENLTVTATFTQKLGANDSGEPRRYIPLRCAAVLVSGVVQIAIGIALWIPELAQAAAWAYLYTSL